MGEAGGILTGSHVFGREMKRMVDEPESRAEIDASLADVYRDMAVAPAACTNKAALGLIGVDVGDHGCPTCRSMQHETAVIRALLERHGMLEATQA